MRMKWRRRCTRGFIAFNGTGKSALRAAVAALVDQFRGQVRTGISRPGGRRQKSQEGRT
jgi:predicted ATPase